MQVLGSDLLVTMTSLNVAPMGKVDKLINKWINVLGELCGACVQRWLVERFDSIPAQCNKRMNKLIWVDVDIFN